MDPIREEMLREIMAADFTAYDLQLYLDTHPCDQRTITLFNNWSRKSKMLHDRFEKIYGPLISSTYSRYPWQWINSPWPWEKS